MEKVVIDVSQYNGVVNWSKVDADEVYIRVGYRGYSAGTIKQDSKFLTNIKGAIAAGIKVGLYFMSQAINTAEAIEEANYVADQIKNYEVTLPIFYDSELSGEKNYNGRADKLTKAQRTANCVAFCKRMVQLGYMAGTYASTSWFKSNLDVNQLLDYKIWVAQYSGSCTATHRKDMWQYTSNGRISGISGNVDISHSYTDFDAATTTTIQSKSATQEFKVRVTTDSLRIRNGPGTNCAQVGSIYDKGVYTITKTSGEWGYLKSGAGWISLKFSEKI